MENVDTPEEPLHPPSEDIQQQRRERREARKVKRQEEKIRKQVEAIRAPQSKKVIVITKRTYDKFQKTANKSDVKNKLFQAAQSSFALSDFIVEKSSNEKPRTKVTSGTIVPSLRKGKVREVPKRKALTRLKRSILAIREKRREEMAEDKPPDESIKLETPPMPLPETIEESSNEIAPTKPTLTIIYSRKFRSYCDHSNDPQISGLVEDILKDLVRFQNRAFEKNQIKARAHRRYVVGFKEVERSLKINKVKLLFIGTDNEPSPGDGGIDEIVEGLKEQCVENGVPYCFPLQRRKIGYLLFKKAPISCVGILDYSGAEDHVIKLLRIVQDSRAQLIPEMENLEIK